MDSTVTLSRKSFWIIKLSILFLLLIIFSGTIYFYGEHIKRTSYLTDRQSFIEQYKVVQWELSAMTFCYEPRGGLIREAVYKGNNLYRVKP